MPDPVFERYKEALKQGHVAVFKGQHKEALARYQEAASLAGHRPLPFVSMGSVLLQMGRAQDAIAAYDEALARAPDDAQALSGKAAALLAAGKRSQSAQLVQQVARLEADQARAAGRAAGERPGRGLGRRTGATAGRGRGLPPRRPFTRRPSTASWRRLPGYQQQGHLDAALDACQRALGVSLGAPPRHLQMARIYFQRGWADRGVERLLLLARLLTLEDDPLTREGVQAAGAGAPGRRAPARGHRGRWRRLMADLASARPGDDRTR